MPTRGNKTKPVISAPATAPARGAREILAIRKRHLGRNLSVSYSQPVKIVRGRGQYLYDDGGRRYLDLVNNVCHVGHCHPRGVEAAQRQMAELNTNTRYLHDNLAEYVLQLTATLPEPLDVCFFVCSGTEANDLALRLARAHTESEQLIVLDHAYHGHSPSLVEISPYKCEGPGGKGLAAHVHKVPMPDPYRGPHRGPYAGLRYADEVRAAVAEIEAAPKVVLSKGAAVDPAGPTVAFVGYAWAGGSATLNGAPVSGFSGLSQAAAGTWVLTVAGQQATANIAAAVDPAVELTATPVAMAARRAKATSGSTGRSFTGSRSPRLPPPQPPTRTHLPSSRSL
mgnify:CR=1 FL=1